MSGGSSLFLLISMVAALVLVRFLAYSRCYTELPCSSIRHVWLEGSGVDLTGAPPADTKKISFGTAGSARGYIIATSRSGRIARFGLSCAGFANPV